MPTTSPPTAKPVQPSIRSFFTTTVSAPKCAPPPPPRMPAPVRLPAGHRAPPATQRQQQEQPEKALQDLVIPPLPRNIPPSAAIRVPTEADMPPLRRVNALLLPVSYPGAFYAYAANNPLSRVITWSQDGQEPRVVGGVVCRLEDVHPDESDAGEDAPRDAPPQNLYIRSLCLLSPYRSMGLARAALEHVVATVRSSRLHVVAVTAHVWTDNEHGLRWYEGRGFARQGAPLRGYYLKLRPDAAWLVRRDAHVAGHSSQDAAGDCRDGASSVPAKRSPAAAVVDLGGPPPPASAPAPPLVSTSSAAAPRPPPSSSSSSSSTTTSSPPPPPASRPKPPSSGLSFQNRRPDMEWNDLPDDMAPPMASLRKASSEGSSATGTSRGGAAAGKKRRERSYPAAAFGPNRR